MPIIFIGLVAAVALWFLYRLILPSILSRKYGFKNSVSGRGGYVQYREGNKVLDIGVEMAGPQDEYDYVVSAHSWTEWSFPKGELIPAEKQVQIADKLIEYVKCARLKWHIVEDINFAALRGRKV